MREVLVFLFKRTFFRFSDLFSTRNKSKIEVVTGFMAILELSKLKRVRLEQQNQFSEIIVHGNSDVFLDLDDEKVASDD